MSESGIKAKVRKCRFRNIVGKERACFYSHCYFVTKYGKTEKH